MTASALSTVERSTLVRAPRSRVWAGLTNLKEFSKWFGVEAEGEFAPGASLRMISTNDSCNGDEFFVHVVKMEAPETFSWRWHPGSKQPGEDTSGEPMTLVEFRLTEVEGGTLVTGGNGLRPALIGAAHPRVQRERQGLGVSTGVAYRICRSNGLARS